MTKTEQEKADHDLTLYGQSFMKNGHRIDPKNVCVVTKDIDTILDEMGTEIRAIREEIMAKNILQDAYKQHIKKIEEENMNLKRNLERAMS